MEKCSPDTSCVFCVVLVVVCCIYQTRIMGIGGMLVIVSVISYDCFIYIYIYICT